MLRTFAVSLCALLCLPHSAGGAITLAHQGRLLDGAGNPYSGTISITFGLYNGPEGQHSVTAEGHTFDGNIITLNNTSVVAESETITSPDGTITYTRGAAYSINYTTGVITRLSPTAIPDGTQVRVSYLYTAEQLWSEEQQVMVTDGIYSTRLGATVSLPAAMHFSQPLYLGVSVGADSEMTPRLTIDPAPFAEAAGVAESANAIQGRAIAAIAPTPGNVLKWNGTSWTPAADNDSTYTAGAGLELSGTSFGVQFGGSGTSTAAARSDHHHDGVYQRRLHRTIVLSPTGTPTQNGTALDWW